MGRPAGSFWTPTPVTVLQSTCTPPTKSSAAEVRNRFRPPSSRRRVPATTASGIPAAASVSSSPAVSTGCALHSTKASKPSPASSETARSSWTGSRRLRYQYLASSVPPGTQVPETVEKNPASVGRGASGASASCNGPAICSTCAECEA
ncbi:hypothetical protein EES44_30045 [Streptomyces sp. ADI96-15]|nr:hypothetical protein EES44_30045 [Streptomyces sp. ADI96-15]